MTDSRYVVRPSKAHFRTILISLAAAFGAVPFHATPCQAGADGLPTAEEIIEKNIEATGGRAALEKLRNRVTKGTFSVAGMGTPAKMMTFAEAPQKQYVVIEADMLGKIEQGTDGETVWQLTTATGPQIKEGAERTHHLRGALFHATLQWKELYKSAECVGIELIDDKPCYKVVLQPADGYPETHYYDKESFREVRSESKMESDMGTITLVTVPSDYKRVDGILLAHKLDQEIVGLQKTVMTIEDIKHNTKIPPDRFKLPREIQELVELEKGSLD